MRSEAAEESRARVHLAETTSYGGFVKTSTTPHSLGCHKIQRSPGFMPTMSIDDVLDPERLTVCSPNQDIDGMTAKFCARQA